MNFNTPLDWAADWAIRGRGRCQQISRLILVTPIVILWMVGIVLFVMAIIGVPLFFGMGRGIWWPVWLYLVPMPLILWCAFRSKK